MQGVAGVVAKNQLIMKRMLLIFLAVFIMPMVAQSQDTLCRPLTYDDLPYFENFENYGYGRDSAINPCWHKGMLGGNPVLNYPYPERAYVGDDTVGLYFCSTTIYSSWAALPRLADTVEISNVELTFIIKRPYSTTTLTRLVVGVASDSVMSGDTNAVFSFEPIDTIELSDEPANSIHPLSVRFDNYTGSGKYIVFYAPELTEEPSNIYNVVHLDNVKLRIASPCHTPQSISILSTTANSVNVTWNEDNSVDSWIVYVSSPGILSNDTIDIDSLISSGIIPSYQFSSNNVTIGGLAHNRDYELVVVASCSGGVGYASYYAAFHTLCQPLTNLPYTEDFESTLGYPYTPDGINNLPQCWLYHNTGTSTQYSGYPIVYTDSASARSGSNSIRFCTYSRYSFNFSDQYAIMPLTDASRYFVSNLRVSFWTRNYSNLISHVIVGVMSNPLDTNTFVPVDTVEVIASPYQPYEHHMVGFANYDGPHGHVAFKTTVSYWAGNPSIDDVTLDETFCPSITAIHAEATASAARLTWDYNTNFGTPSGFIINYRNANDPDDSLVTVTTTADDLLLTGLDTNTTYWVSVVADCGSLNGGADTSLFTTQALPCISWDTVDLPVDTIVLGAPGRGINAITPINASAPFSRVQHLFLSTEIPVTGPTMLNGIGFDYAYTEPYQVGNCEIYLGHTTQTELSSSLTSFGQLVYSGTLNLTTEGWNYVQFNQGTFLYDGTSNLCVTITKNSGVSAPTTRTFRHETTIDHNMTSWSARPNRYTPYSAGTTDLDKRSNTRLITGGQEAYCTGWASCIPPIVKVYPTAAGDYRITWVPGYHETSWDVDYRVLDIGNWVNVVSETESTEYILPMSELQQGTLYEIRVTANCGDTVISSMDTITTPCVNLTIPFYYGFEGLPTNTNRERPVIPCWHQLNDATQYFGLPGITAGAHTGNRGLGFGVSTSSYHCNYQAIVFPPVDTGIDAINSLYLNFWARSSTMTEDPILYVGVMTDPDDINTFYTVDSVFIDPATNGWDRYEVSFENYNGDGQYIAIRANRPTEWYWTATIDDITLSYEPMCRRVDNIRFRDVTTDNATVSWTRGGDEAEWELTIGDSIYYLTDTFYTINGLERDTVYTVTIRAICDENDTSNAWSASFHTPCYLLATLPLINDFENEPYYQLHTTSYVEAFPACWRRVNDITNNNNANGRPYIRNTGVSGIHGNNSMYWELTYEYNNFFVVLPPVDKSVYNTRDLYLMFYARTLSNSEPGASFLIGVMDHDSDTAHFVPVDTITPTIDVTLYTVSLANYTGTGNYIAIRDSRPSYGRELLLDDVVLTDHLCFPVSHLRASCTDTSVTLVWSHGASDSVAANELSYTAVLGNDTVRGITDTFYTFHSLANTTLYSYAVATECPTLNSIFQTGRIQTECPPLTYGDLPYFEDFENYEYGYDTTISPCWRRGSVPSTIPTRPFATHLYIGEDTVGLNMSASTYYYRWAALPRLDTSIDITQLELNFLIQRPGSGYSPLPSTRLIVGVAEDVTWYSGELPATSMEDSVPSHAYTYSGFVPVDTIDLSDEPVSSLHSISVRFENYTGNGRYIVFYTPSPESGMPNNGFDLDNITLRMAVQCPTVQNIRVTGTTADSVFATWSGTTGADSWLVYIGRPGFEIGSVPPHVVNDTTARIGGLDPNTDYEMVVVSSCGGNEGYPSYPEQFHTLCSPLTTLPFVEGFESADGIPSYTTYTNVNTLPSCWLRHNTGSAGEYSGAPLVHNDSTLAHSGSNAMRFHTANISPECSDQYAIMPLTDSTIFPVSSLQVSFWMRTAHFYYNSFIVVGVMSDPTDTSTFIAVDTARIASLNDYSNHTIRLNRYFGPHGHVAFKAPFQSPVNRPYIDDIVLEEMPCGPAEELHVVHAGLDSLTLSWTDTSSAYIFWHLEYDTIDFNPGTGAVTPILVTDTFYTLTGLDSATVYHIYVYPDCFDSVVARHLVATTLLSAPTSVPYTCNFDDVGANGWILLNGTQGNYWMVSDVTGNPGGSLYITDNGGSNHYSGSESLVFATRTFHFDTAGEYAYRYDWRCNGEDNRDFFRSALIPAQAILEPGEYSGFDDGSALPTGGIALDGGRWLSQHNNWQNQCGTFPIATPGEYIWVFMWHNDGSGYNQYPAAIDNVHIAPNSCPMPQNVTWEISGDSLILSWDSIGGQGEWEATLGDTTVTVAYPNCTFTNLPLSIIYTVHIRTVCGPGDTSLTFTASIVNNRHLVSATANNPAYGSATGSGLYYNGDVAVLTAMPFTGYYFAEWNDGVTDNPRSIVVTSDTSLIAVFQEEEGIDAVATAKCVVYPNPTSGKVTIATSEPLACASITDMMGRREEVGLAAQGNGVYTIDLTARPQAIYLLTLTTTEGHQHTVRLLKQQDISAR